MLEKVYNVLFFNKYGIFFIIHHVYNIKQVIIYIILILVYIGIYISYN